MSESSEISISLGKKLDSTLAKFTDKNNKVDVRKILDHHAPRLAVLALEKAELMLESDDPDDFKNGMDIIRTFAPKMYSSKDTDKKVEEVAKSNMSQETMDRMLSIIEGQNKILHLKNSNEIEYKEVKNEK